MLLVERCAPGDQAISREPAAPLFIVVTAKQVFDAVEQRHRQAAMCEAPGAAAAKLRQPPPSLSRLSNVSKTHEVSQLGHALNHAHGGKGGKWLPTASTTATRAMPELKHIMTKTLLVTQHFTSSSQQETDIAVLPHSNT